MFVRWWLWLLLAAPALAQPYVRTQSSTGAACLFWPKRAWTFSVNEAGSQRTPGTTEFTAIARAAASWSALSAQCSDFVFEVGPRVADTAIGYVKDAPDNRNLVIFRETRCDAVVPTGSTCWESKSCGSEYNCWSHTDETIALTTTTYSKSTGLIFDADIEYNAAPHAGGGEAFLFTTIDSPPCSDTQDVTCVSTDVQNTTTHEIGHAIGLDHADVAGSTMEPSAPVGELQKRLIDAGSAEGFCSIYPKTGPTPPCDELGIATKKVLAESLGAPPLSFAGCSTGGLPLAGLALWALARMMDSRHRRRPS